MGGAFFEEGVEFVVVEAEKGSGGRGGSTDVAVVETVIFGGEVAQVLSLLGLPFLPITLRLETEPLGHFDHTLFLLPHSRPNLLLLVEPSLVTHLARLHAILNQLLLAGMGLLHESCHLIDLLLLKAFDARVDVVLIGVVEKIKLFLFHHVGELL
jgi:hypothetical protein